MEPTLFRSRRVLERLADLAIGLALAAITATIFTELFNARRDSTAVFTGAPTLFFGTVWALLLRWRRTVSGGRVRVGWLASIPLAMTNSAVAAGLMLATLNHSARPITNFFLGVAAGATVGVIFWGPALVATLVCFGIPIAWGQLQASKGLAGQERGDSLVGLTSASIAGVALLTTLAKHTRHSGAGFTLALSAGGVTLGVLAAILAWRRARQRREFVAAVEDGRVPSFRVEPSAEGKVLVRIVSSGEGYRVADFAEEVARFDAGGEVTRTSGR